MFHKGLPTRLGVYFHAVEPPSYPPIRELVAALREQGYRFATTSELFAAMDAGGEDRIVGFSFDDNFKSWHDSLPLWADLDVRGTFYTNTLPFRDTASRDEIDAYFDRIGHHTDRQSLTRAELREMHAAGHEIGAHGHSHEQLSALSLAEAEADIVRNREELQDLLAAPVNHFAVPFGMPRHFSRELEQVCDRIGFATVAYATPGMQHQPFAQGILHRTGFSFAHDVPNNLRRFGVDGRRFVSLTGRSPLG